MTLWTRTVSTPLAPQFATEDDVWFHLVEEAVTRAVHQACEFVLEHQQEVGISCLVVALSVLVMLYRGRSQPEDTLYTASSADVAKSMTMDSLEVAQLWIYPVKSLKGINLSTCFVKQTGLEYDRQWMVVYADTLQFVTQRQVPQMATICTEIAGSSLVLSHPKTGECHLSLDYPDEDIQVKQVSIWTDMVDAIDLGNEAAHFVTMTLNLTSRREREYRLVRIAKNARRLVQAKHLVTGKERTAFADSYPLLMTTESSLAKLNAWIQENEDNIDPVPMENFRPNIVVRGNLPAFVEDAWANMAIGDVAFRVVRKCTRCILPSTNQRTGIRRPDREPVKTLRRRRSSDGRTFFGVNLICSDAYAEDDDDASILVSTGDAVTVKHVNQ